MDQIIAAAIFGLIGGIARAFVGLLKHYRINKKTKFKPSYLIITIIGAGIIGIFTSLVITANYTISLISGYVGIDIIENLVKIYKKKLNL